MTEATIIGVTCGPVSVVPGERARVIYDIGHAVAVHRTRGTEWTRREDFNALCAEGTWTALNVPIPGRARVCAYMLRDSYPDRDKFLDALLADHDFCVRESGPGYVLVIMNHAFTGHVAVREAEHQRLLAMNTLPAAIAALFMSNIEAEIQRATTIAQIAKKLHPLGLTDHFLQSVDKILGARR